MLTISNLKCIIFIFLLYACGRKVNNLNINNEDLKLVDGIMLYKEKPYTGNTFFKNDTIIINSASYLNGKKHGEEKRFFYNGDLAVSRSYINGKPSGTHKTWWDNGQPKAILQYDNLGNPIGTHREWYSNGQLAKEFNFTNGKEDGTQKQWDVNGKIKANFVTINGERFGLIGYDKCKALDYED